MQTPYLDIDKIIFNEKQISDSISKTAEQITIDYEDKQDEGIVVLGLLKGAAVFMSDLVRKINLKLELEFMCVSSYGNSKKSSNNLNILLDLQTDIKGKHVIIAEDVIDSGYTLNTLINLLKKHEPASIEICALLDKHISEYNLNVKYCCFDCPNEFTVGYGLDYAQKYRNLPYIASLKQ